ncbi:MAG: hypothetical protein XXXJIFNMEKO3_00684 [Candidatus Erwinia impunctatus]
MVAYHELLPATMIKRMPLSKTLTSPNYTQLADALKQQGVAMSPAEMHGLLTGMIAGGYQSSHWQSQVYDLTNDGLAFSQVLLHPLQELYQSISDTLADEGFLFQLFLPEGESVTLFDRADELAGWVNHFLLGLGISQPGLDKVKGETGEAIDDLRTIGQLGYDDDEEPEAFGQALEEVIEYVRVAVLLCYDTFVHSHTFTQAESVNKPTLH